MKFEIGDTVMHWTHGLGQIMGLEERVLTGETQLYYVVRIQDFSVWVPADEQLASRLRAPTSAAAFKKLLAILSGPAEPLPSDRQERKSRLRAEMNGGDAAAMCHVIRDLTSFAQVKPLNYDDKSTLKRASTMLLGEWEYSLRIPFAEAEGDLQRLLKPAAVDLPQ